MIEIKNYIFFCSYQSTCTYVFTCSHTQTKPHRHVQNIYSRVVWHQSNNTNRNIYFEILSYVSLTILEVYFNSEIPKNTKY